MPFPKLPPGGTVASRRHYSVVDNYGDIPTELSSYTLIQVQHFVLIADDLITRENVSYRIICREVAAGSPVANSRAFTHHEKPCQA